jgi:hypothetical protein
MLLVNSAYVFVLKRGADGSERERWYQGRWATPGRPRPARGQGRRIRYGRRGRAAAERTPELAAARRGELAAAGAATAIPCLALISFPTLLYGISAMVR